MCFSQRGQARTIAAQGRHHAFQKRSTCCRNSFPALSDAHLDEDSSLGCGLKGWKYRRHKLDSRPNQLRAVKRRKIGRY